MQSHQLCVCRAGKSLNPSGSSTGHSLESTLLILQSPGRGLETNSWSSLKTHHFYLVFIHLAISFLGFIPLKVILTYCWNVTMDRHQILQNIAGKISSPQSLNQQHPVRCEHPLISFIPLLHGKTAFGKTRAHTGPAPALGAAAAPV